MGLPPGVLEFTDLKKGMQARVVRVCPQNPDLNRLMEMGLVPGTVFQVVKVAPFGDPIEIDVRGYRLCLRRREASGIEIESVD